jgi:hypothetical protein
VTPKQFRRLRLLYRLYKGGLLFAYYRLRRERDIKRILDREFGGAE